MKTYLLLFFTLVCAISYGQNDSSHCKILKNIKLKYTQTDDQSSYIIIKNNDHIEYHRNDKYFIKSKLVWISDCEYNMTMTEITLPNFPFGPGEVMNVKFTKIEKDSIQYIATVRGQSVEGKFVILN